MYGPDIVLHSENMAVPAMQENSQKGTDKNAEKPRFDGINMEAILSKNEAEHGSTRMDKATWTAFHTAMLMKYSLAELEKIGEQARKLKESDFSNLGGNGVFRLLWHGKLSLVRMSERIRLWRGSAHLT